MTLQIFKQDFCPVSLDNPRNHSKTGGVCKEQRPLLQTEMRLLLVSLKEADGRSATEK